MDDRYKKYTVLKYSIFPFYATKCLYTNLIHYATAMNWYMYSTASGCGASKSVSKNYLVFYHKRKARPILVVVQYGGIKMDFTTS